MSTPATTPPPAAPALPFDPLRLLRSLLARWRWLAIGLLVGATLGLAFGLWRAQTRYEVTVQLMRREIPGIFRSGETGEPFRPRQLSAATLTGMAGSTNVLRRVSEKSNPRVSLGMLRSSIEVRDQRATDYLLLTLSGYDSAAATVELANLWAAEIIDFTRDLQARESREMRQYLEQQLDLTEAELSRARQAILDYSRREGIVNADKQIDASLRALGDFDIRLTTAKQERDAARLRIESLRTEIRRHGPIAERLDKAREELATLRSQYTDAHPAVAELLARIQELETLATAPAAATTDAGKPTQTEKGTEAKTPAKTVVEDDGAHTGTFLSNTFFLEIIQLRDRLRTLDREIEELGSLRAAESDRLQKLPEKEMGLAQLSLSAESLEKSRALLFNRLREARVFEERAPGYYQLFAPASIDSVGEKGRTLKVAAFSIAGLLAGLGGALALALAAELLDPTLRTPAEASRALGAPLVARARAGESTAEATARLWMGWIGSGDGPPASRSVFVPRPGPGEQVFWSLLVPEAARLLPNLRIITLGGGDVPPVLAALENAAAGPRHVRIDADSLSLERAAALVEELRAEVAAGGAVWLRLTGTVREPLTTLARAGARPLVLALVGVAHTNFWKEQAERLRRGGCEAAGIVAVSEDGQPLP